MSHILHNRWSAFLFAGVSLLPACGLDYGAGSLREADPLERLGCGREANDAAASEDRPVAVCDVSRSEIRPIWESADFIGEASWDPNDVAIIDWDWQLISQPTGSSVDLGEGVFNRYGFTPDLAGEYQAQLIATNASCVMSDPCAVSVMATPTEDLWIEMFWSEEGDDMDLHLVENGGAIGSSSDCHFYNCTSDLTRPDWGTAYLPYDDPRLDLDDIEWTGPENINISEPAQGNYKILVHDYPTSVRKRANDVTVRVTIDGKLVFSDTKTISGEDSITEFAIIDWPSGQVKPL